MDDTIRAVVVAGLDPAIHRAKRRLDVLMDAGSSPGMTSWE
jgi:hypothetical protein